MNGSQGVCSVCDRRTRVSRFNPPEKRKLLLCGGCKVALLQHLLEDSTNSPAGTVAAVWAVWFADLPDSARNEFTRGGWPQDD